jgi:hypothetical protein
MMFLWIMPALAAGLVFADIPGSVRLSERPAEILTWCLSTFLLSGEVFIFATIWKHVRDIQCPIGPPTFYWRLLFRDTIGLPSPAFVRWTHLTGAFAIALAAGLTARPLLAATWITTTIAGVLRRSWEQKTVERALETIERHVQD